MKDIKKEFKRQAKAFNALSKLSAKRQEYLMAHIAKELSEVCLTLRELVKDEKEKM